MSSKKLIEDSAPANFVNRRKLRRLVVPSEAAPAIQVTAISSGSPPPEREVDFLELADGTLIEMIEDPNNAANSLFAVYKNGNVQIRATVECEGQVLVPVSRGAEIFKHVRLPRGSQSYLSARSWPEL